MLFQITCGRITQLLQRRDTTECTDTQKSIVGSFISMEKCDVALMKSLMLK